MILLFVLFFVCSSYSLLAIRFDRSQSFFAIVGGLFYLFGALIGILLLSFFTEKHSLFNEFNLLFFGAPSGLIMTLVFRSIWRDSLEKNTDKFSNDSF